MHAKLRNGVYLLYRTKYVTRTLVDKKTGKDVKVGQSKQVYVMSIPESATGLPTKPSKNKVSFTEDERAYLEHRIFAPARVAEEAERLEADARRCDPYWRINDAAMLLQDAVRVAREFGVLLELERVKEFSTAYQAVQAVAAEPIASMDPMEQMVESIRRAGTWLAEGGYGKAPEEGVRSTKPWHLWQSAWDLLTGPESYSIIRRLQVLGYVTKKGAKGSKTTSQPLPAADES
jgi:hypothetical protein